MYHKIERDSPMSTISIKNKDVKVTNGYKPSVILSTNTRFLTSQPTFSATIAKLSSYFFGWVILLNKSGPASSSL